jgi:hypothetical protein
LDVVGFAVGQQHDISVPGFLCRAAQGELVGGDGLVGVLAPAFD